MLLVTLALALVLPGLASGARGGPSLPGVGPIGQLQRAPAGDRGASRYRTGQLVVRFSNRLDSAERTATAHAARAEIGRRLPLRGVRVLSLKRGVSVAASLARLRRRPGVIWAEPNFVRRLHGISNDPLLREQWGLHATGQLVGRFRVAAPDVDVDAPEAWDVTTGSPDVTVAVIDSGIAYNHPDLAPNIAPGGRDFVDGDDDPSDPAVGLSHGSLVASIIAARGGDGEGVAGVAPSVRVLPLRVAGLDGTLTSADAAAAYTYAASHGARIVNASFGGFGISQVELDAIRAAPATLFVASAGNDALNTDTNPVSPCVLDAPNIVCVAASDLDDSLADFSNFGAATVDLSAAGVAILGAQPPFADEFADGFEVDLSNWVADAGSTWGRTRAARWRGSFSLADSPGGNYPNNVNHALRTLNAVDLTGQTRCRLDHFMRLDSELGRDGVVVEAATSSGGPWTVLNSYSGSSGGLFQGFAEDLAAFVGEPAVYVRFRFVSNGSVTGPGAEIDDVAIQCSSPTSVSGRDFAYGDGTSFSAPLVSGVAAVALSVAPEMSVETLRSALLKGVDPAGALAGKTVTGGRSSAMRTLLSIPPGAATGAASVDTTSSSATIDGTVRPHGIPTTWRVEYGPTPAYGFTTDSTSAGNARNDQPVRLTLSELDLSRGTTIHYRAVASNAGGTAFGADRSFRAAGGAAPAAPAAPAAGGAPGDTTPPKLGKPRVRRSKKGKISLVFTLSETASVTAALDRGRGAFKRKRARRLSAGKRRLPLPRLGPGRYRIALVATDSAGNAALRELTVSVKRSGRRSRRAAARGADLSSAALPAPSSGPAARRATAGDAAVPRSSWPLGEGSIGFGLPDDPFNPDPSDSVVPSPQDYVCFDPELLCYLSIKRAVDEFFREKPPRDPNKPLIDVSQISTIKVIRDPKTGEVTYDVTLDTGQGSKGSVEGALTFELLELKYFGKEMPLDIYGERGQIVASAAGRRSRSAVQALLRNEIATVKLLDRVALERDPRAANGAVRRIAREADLLRRARRELQALHRGPIRFTRAELQRARRLVRERGLPAAHVRALRRLGASDSYLSQLRAALTGTAILRYAGERFPAALTNPQRLARGRRFGRIVYALSP